MALSYKVFPGTPYYSNTNLTTKAGEIVNTTAATYVNTTYGTVSVGGSTYYVAYGMMVSFWNSSFTGAQIDDALNKVINADTTPTANSTKMITSGGVKSALDVRVMKCSTAFAIPAVNSPITKSMPGLTADHELVRWNFADSGTPVAENAPPVDLTWTTAAGQFVITNTGGTTTYTIQPVFALPSAIAIT